MNQLLSDAKARQQAIDVSGSFIVQAPAGSGKTGLITQRFLNLLSVSENPEDILAITYTRKAANEMRERIIAALESAKQPEPKDAHAKTTWSLAVRALARSDEKRWQLIENPARLRIQTIDSFCASLVKQMPLLARFGAQPGIEENASQLYRSAAESFVTSVLIERSLPEVEPSVVHLLRGLNNQLNTLVELLTILLARRDQWIRHFVRDGRLLERERLESALESFIENQLQVLSQNAPKTVGEEFSELSKLILEGIQLSGMELPGEHTIFRLHGLSGWPDDRSPAIGQWQAIAKLLFTGKGQLKKRFNKNDGVLGVTAAKGMEQKQLAQLQKEKLQSITDELASYPKFTQQLFDILKLPETQFKDTQWQTIEALNISLNYLLGFLTLEFQASGKVDFIELSLAALRALQDDTGATDLALKLDYQIKHILVDEFQDTSHGQYELLKLLTEGWQRGDGRTLFVVGDPMQSIYRFREADVGLYLDSRQNGLGNINLQALNLTTNFRSVAGVVNWVNRAFKQVFPEQEDTMLGAVPVSLAVANNQDDSTAVEFIHALSPSDNFQASRVLQRIQAIRETSPEESIAVLVRTKAHAQKIIQLLKQSGVAVEAIEMERLEQRAMIKNLRNLTRVLLNPCDNLAWAGLLRSELCGLSLRAMQSLFDRPGYFPDVLTSVTDSDPSVLDSDDQQRLQWFYSRITPFIDNVGDKELAFCVRAAWFSLGGPQLNSSERDLRDADQFFAALHDKLSDSPIAEVQMLDDLIEQLFSAPDVSNASQAVKVMSIHKSKGLEFDHVFIPHLEKQPRNERSQLVLWQELSESSHTDEPITGADDRLSNFLVAPMKTGDEQADRIYQMLNNINKQKQLYENGRLLYVGATRAKKRLYLLAESQVTVRDDEFVVKTPHNGSLLHQLWPVVESQINQQLKSYDEPSVEALIDNQSVVQLTRVKTDKPMHYFEPQLVSDAWRNTLSSDKEGDEFAWDNATAAAVGTLVHEYLQIIAEQGVEQWSTDRLQAMVPTLERCLRQAAVSEQDITVGVQQVLDAICKTISDETGRWVLANHREAESEFALSIKMKERFATYVIDRTFIDDTGTRWIIDFKTSQHKGQDLEGFFRNELTKYQPQLKQYAIIMSSRSSEPVRCALYLPMHQRLIEYPEDFYLK